MFKGPIMSYSNPINWSGPGQQIPTNQTTIGNFMVNGAQVQLVQREIYYQVQPGYSNQLQSQRQSSFSVPGAVNVMQQERIQIQAVPAQPEGQIQQYGGARQNFMQTQQLTGNTSTAVIQQPVTYPTGEITLQSMLNSQCGNIEIVQPNQAVAPQISIPSTSTNCQYIVNQSQGNMMGGIQPSTTSAQINAAGANQYRFQSQVKNNNKTGNAQPSQTSVQSNNIVTQPINPNHYGFQDHHRIGKAPQPSTTGPQNNATVASNVSSGYVNQNPHMVQNPQSLSSPQNSFGKAKPAPFSYEASTSQGNFLIANSSANENRQVPVSDPKIRVRTIQSLNNVDIGQIDVNKNSVNNINSNRNNNNNNNDVTLRHYVPQVTGDEQFEEIFNENPSRNPENIYQVPSNSAQFVGGSNIASRSQQQQEKSATIQGNIHLVINEAVTDGLNRTKISNVGAPQNVQSMNIRKNSLPPNAIPSSAQVQKSVNTPQIVQSMTIHRNSPPPNAVPSNSQAHKNKSNNNPQLNKPAVIRNNAPQQFGQGFIKVYPPAGGQSNIVAPSNNESRASPPANKSPSTVSATTECAVQATSKSVISATHRLPMTVEKPMSKNSAPIVFKPNIDLNQSRLSLQASVLAKNQTTGGTTQNLINKTLEGSNIAQTSSSPAVSTVPISSPAVSAVLTVPAVSIVPNSSSSLVQKVPIKTVNTDRVQKKNEDLLRQVLEKPNIVEGSKLKEDLSINKKVANNKEAQQLTVSSIFKDFLKGTTETNVAPTAKEGIESIQKIPENDKDKDKEKTGKAGEDGEKEELDISVDEIIIQAIMNNTKKLKAGVIDIIPKKEEVSPSKSPPPPSPSKSPPISIESSLNDLDVIVIQSNQSKAEKERRKNLNDLPNEVNLDVPIKKKPGPKSKTMPAYLESLTKIDEMTEKQNENSPVCKKPEGSISSVKLGQTNVTKNPEVNNLDKNPKNKNGDKKLEDQNLAKKLVEKTWAKMQQEKARAKQEGEKSKDKNVNIISKKSEIPNKKPEKAKVLDWVEKLKNSSAHLVSKDEPPTKTSPEPESSRRKSVDTDSEAPPAKKLKTDEKAVKDQTTNERIKKLELLKKYLETDEDTDRKRRASSDEESNSRRKMVKTKVIKNRNMRREKIALVSKDFKLKSKQNEEKVNAKVKSGTKCHKEDNRKSTEQSPKITEADSSIIDEVEEAKKSDDGNNNTQTSSIDDDVKPDFAGLTKISEAASLSPARITSTSEEFDLNGMIRAFQSVDNHRCMNCAKTVGTNEFWINVKSTELKCAGCLTQPTKNVCYKKNHEDEIKKLKLEIQELRRKNRKLEKKAEKRIDPRVLNLFKNVSHLREMIGSESE